MSESGGSGRLPRVGVRELRQNLSVYLRRVETGETLEVTEHGRPVARLTPTPPAELGPYRRMIAEGRIRPGRGNLADLGPPLPATPGPTLTQILLEMRDEERW